MGYAGGQFSGGAASLRAAAPKAVGFIAAGRGSEVAQFVTKDVSVNGDDGVVDFRVVRQENAQLGWGQTARVTAITARGGPRSSSGPAIG